MTVQAEAQEAFERACRHDSRGEENAAIPEYERSLALGLPAPARAAALLGLGSSLRNVGRTDEAVSVLHAAVTEFPDHAALRAFLALALHSHGDGREAVVVLLDVVLRYAPIGEYARALGEYRDRLRRGPAAGESYAEQAATLTRHEFVRAHPYPFLVALGSSAQESDDPFADETDVGLRVELVDGAPELVEATPLVLAVRALGSLVPSAITVGRATSSDVVIRDSCVSKIHAFFRVHGERCELSDAGSRNGTWIGARRVEPRGAPTPVVTGDVIAFGRAAFFFLDAGACWDRLRAGKRG